MLTHWPDKVFQSLVSLRRLKIVNCKNLTGYSQPPLEPATSRRRQHLQGLESLWLADCPSLIEMFNLPASLKRMDIYQCHKLESIFGKQQGMSEFVEGPSCSEPIVHATVSELSSSPVNHLFPSLEDLSLSRCDSLLGVLHLPRSLKTIFIGGCRNIQVLSCQLDEIHKPQITTSINVLEPSAAARDHSLPPCLESLTIWSCAGMLGILHLPASLKELSIQDNSRLTVG